MTSNFISHRVHLKGEVTGSQLLHKALTAFCFGIAAIIISASSNASSVTIPEHLQYDISLSGLHIGSITLDARDSTPYVQLSARVSSAEWVSVLYRVDDTVVSLIRQGQQKWLPKNFPFMASAYRIRIIEGHTRISKDVIFDYGKKTISYEDHINREKRDFLLKEFTLDPLTSLYYLRRLPLQVGKPVWVKVFNNKMLYKVEAQVLKRETITIPLGTFNTILIRSNMDSIGDGLFYSPGDIYIWLGDDDKRMPVMIEKRINALVEDTIPEFLRHRIPDFLKKKLSTGTVRATLIKM